MILNSLREFPLGCFVFGDLLSEVWHLYRKDRDHNAGAVVRRKSGTTKNN